MENFGAPVAGNPDAAPDHLPSPAFAPLVLQRPIGPHGKPLRLVPGVPAVPDVEFIFFLVVGYKGHQAYLRQMAGPQFKNFENHIRGHHKLSATTRKTVADKLGMPVEFVDRLCHGRADGPLLPQLLWVFHGIERFTEQVTSSALEVEVACPCCGHDVLDDLDAWWASQSLQLGKDEYGFVERVLRAVLGARLLAAFFAPADAEAGDVEPVVDWAEPERHPMGNWFSHVLSRTGCHNLVELSVKLQLRQGATEQDAITHRRLKAWSSGSAPIPPAAVTAIEELAGVPGYGLMAARSFALLGDFIAATAIGDRPPTPAKVREVLYNRCNRVQSNLLIAGMQRAKNRKLGFASSTVMASVSPDEVLRLIPPEAPR